ncbi:hypothetical protein D3C73_1666210 [compost metagenome]
MRIIDCYNCDGKGWEIEIGVHNLPLQETCPVCKGEKTLLADEEFARHILGEVRE